MMEQRNVSLSSIGRCFAYCRVSTTEQTTENQVLAIGNAGYHVRQDRVVSETINGSVKAMERPDFARLVDRLEEGDSLSLSVTVSENALHRA